MVTRRTSRTTRRSTHKPPEPRLKRAWHIVTTNGADVTVSAHSCDHYDGVLAFRDITDAAKDQEETHLVRAFGPGTWAECELVDLSSMAAEART